jgi:hypothetical protein
MFTLQFSVLEGRGFELFLAHHHSNGSCDGRYSSTLASDSECRCSLVRSVGLARIRLEDYLRKQETDAHG